MEKGRIKQESNSNWDPSSGGETIAQKHAHFLLWCEIPDENTACRYGNKCGKVFRQLEKNCLTNHLRTPVHKVYE